MHRILDHLIENNRWNVKKICQYLEVEYCQVNIITPNLRVIRDTLEGWYPGFTAEYHNNMSLFPSGVTIIIIISM